MRYDLNDLQSDLNHAYQLADATVEQLQAGPDDSQRNYERICALSWVLRDLLEKACKDIEQHFRVIGTTCKNWSAEGAEKGGEA
ncbi:hypothetical protein [Mesorhizobium sp. CN2-181]|uniref:hypothetical protein n=1 Tax=Mesorhizobium yinganensis TaxID=3157707 RepID=UPI0032B7CB5E